MAKPDGTTVIRYWPVEHVWREPQNMTIGISYWAARGVGWSNPVPEETTAYIDGPIEWSGRVEYRRGPEPVWMSPEWVEYLTAVIIIPPMGVGQYAEVDFVFLDESGAPHPLDTGSLPAAMNLVVNESGSYYAGGVIQVGIYADGEFVELASFQHLDPYFGGDSSVVPGGWDVLPPETDPYPVAMVDMGDGGADARLITLYHDFPVPLFWTGFQRSVELLGAETEVPPDSGGDGLPDMSGEGWSQLSLAAGSSGYGEVGFSDRYGITYGGLTPDTLLIQGVDIVIRRLIATSGIIDIDLGGVFGLAEAKIVTAGLLLSLDVGDHEHGSYASSSLDGPIFEDGGAYDLYLYLGGDLRSEP